MYILHTYRARSQICIVERGLLKASIFAADRGRASSLFSLTWYVGAAASNYNLQSNFGWRTTVTRPRSQPRPDLLEFDFVNSSICEDQLAATTNIMSQMQPVHSDSISAHNQDHEVQKKAKSRRPASKIKVHLISYWVVHKLTDLLLAFRYCFSAATIEGMAVSSFTQAVRCYMLTYCS